MALNYIVSAQKPTVITHAVVGNFTSPNDLNLVLAKTNRIELLSITPSGLKPFREVPIFGRIATVKAFRPPNEDVDSLLILTVKYNLVIICWDSAGEIRTRAFGNIADRVGRPSETGIIASVHCSGLMIFRLFDGLLKVVQWADGKDLKCYNIRCDDLYIIDIDFLQDTAQPSVVYIYHDQNGRHLKAASVDSHEESQTLWKQDNIEAEASIVIHVPLPFGGVIVIGEESISYIKDSNIFVAIAPPQMHQSQINCYARIDRDGQRFLLGDLLGRIFMLLLDYEVNAEGARSVKDLKLELLGETSIPECMVYLDNGVVFIGSRFGDSQLVRLTAEPLEDDTFIIPMENYVNLAPIRDMVVINQNGQKEVITCSGGFKDGSLRVIRNGVGIEELASVELPGIKSLFALNVDSELDDYLVVGFIDETHIFKICGEELDDTSLTGMCTEEPTLWAGKIKNGGGIVQVTPSQLILIHPDKSDCWKPLQNISVVSANEKSGQVVVACGNILHYIRVTDHIELITTVTCDYEIAAIDVGQIGENLESNLCAVSYWTEMSVALRSLPDLKEIVREKVGGEMLARSLLIYSVESIVYLLVALGDGTLHYLQIDQKTGALTEPKKATLGTQPTTLKRFYSKDVCNVFACSDRPAVIYPSNQKLVFSNVNLKLVFHMSPLNSEVYKDCLVMSDGQMLVIGRIDDIQKLHIRTVALGEGPSRIAHQPETNTLAVLVQRIEFVSSDGTRRCRPCASKLAASTSGGTSSPSSSHDDSERVEISSVIILDHNTFEVIHSHQFGPSELALSLKSCKLGDDPQVYYAVGTVIVENEEPEAKLGKIYIFQMNPATEGKRLRLIHEKEVKGAPYSIQILMGKLVVAVNSCVRLFEWTPDKELRLECSDFDNVTALYLKTKGDLVLVADLMRSLSLLSYKSMESSFEKIARDVVTNWLSACEIIDAETFLGAENSYNLFTVVKDTSPMNRDESTRLQEAGMFYLGDLVNVFCHGSLLSSHLDTFTPPLSTPILYGTCDGSVGIIVQLPPPYYQFVHEVERRIASETKNCMRIEHSSYRAFYTEKRSEPAEGFVDGDLVESILDMPRDAVARIVENLKMPDEQGGGELKTATVEEVLKFVEDLSRVH